MTHDTEPGAPTHPVERDAPGRDTAPGGIAVEKAHDTEPGAPPFVPLEGFARRPRVEVEEETLDTAGADAARGNVGPRPPPRRDRVEHPLARIIVAEEPPRQEITSPMRGYGQGPRPVVPGPEASKARVLTTVAGRRRAKPALSMLLVTSVLLMLGLAGVGLLALRGRRPAPRSPAAAETAMGGGGDPTRSGRGAELPAPPPGAPTAPGAPPAAAEAPTASPGAPTAPGSPAPAAEAPTASPGAPTAPGSPAPASEAPTASPEAPVLALGSPPPAPATRTAAVEAAPRPSAALGPTSESVAAAAGRPAPQQGRPRSAPPAMPPTASATPPPDDIWHSQ